MKRILYPLWGLLLLLSAACGGSKESNGTRLQGEIKGLGDDTLYIYGMDRLYDCIDTLPVKNGKFTALLQTDTIAITRLLFSDGTRYPLFFGNGETILVKGDTANLSTLQISGNQANEEMTLFTAGLAIDSLGTPAEQAEHFIKTHAASPVSIYLLYDYFVLQPNPDFKKIEELIGHLTGDLKDRPMVGALLKEVQSIQDLKQGSSIPHFMLPDVNGKKLSRTDFKDKYLLLHFWASWDEASRDSLASLRSIYEKEKKNKHFAMLGISLDVEKSAWKSAIEQDTLRWSQVCALAGWDTPLVTQLSIHTLPFNLLLNKQGRVEGKNLTKAQLEQKLKDIERVEKLKADAEKRRKQRK
ncbi:MAG: AhpC/TSA family protein [Bacteroides sp.]|nr:AhpC/TSA family protein [Bacteroides sp.]